MFKNLFIPLLSLASPAYADCYVPDSLNGLTIISVVDPLYSTINPNSGDMYEITYTEETYTAKVLNSNEPDYVGKYHYKRIGEINDGTGLFTGIEELPVEKPSHTILFKCMTNDSGIAVFTQLPGEHEEKLRQNTTKYNIISRR
ncbi:hypothetical protein [Photobacterium angustum]|uniref:Uncharacterized protein n=1 Tax=Photobacterium angustum TaxID=661 RepID=A0A855SDY1_PHOAN|nr:hypothetical protein [Photobacterium angustum]KJF81565.1 hypothetical protein UB36_10995 [Photobacterium damselae subsp. damselae]KJF92291.1 hypothetical protein UB39_21435 [Photobacterium angustum]KJG06054.1 hypothetical protein UB33_10270 [Photobacterium angustum]KJG16857.1 hypothetical protein UA33_12620 [Photobacterium angustum]KJG23124.1 hypothetical protein UA39_11960 [Photobacterium angustum]